MAEHTRHPGGPRRRQRVYVVEADPAERARVAAVLEAAGYDVTAVATVVAAVTQGFWGGDPARVLLASPRPPDTTPRVGNY